MDDRARDAYRRWLADPGDRDAFDVWWNRYQQEFPDEFTARVASSGLFRLDASGLPVLALTGQSAVRVELADGPAVYMIPRQGVADLQPTGSLALAYCESARCTLPTPALFMAMDVQLAYVREQPDGELWYAPIADRVFSGYRVKTSASADEQDEVWVERYGLTVRIETDRRSPPSHDEVIDDENLVPLEWLEEESPVLVANRNARQEDWYVERYRYVSPAIRCWR